MTQTEPQFKPGDRVFSHYACDKRNGISGWGTINRIDHTVRGAVHGVTGSPLPDTTWYWIDTDEGSTELLDDAHGNFDMARILPPHIAKQYGYGDDPNPPVEGYRESLQIFRNLLEQESVDEGLANEYVRGGVELIADLFGVKGVFIADRIDQVLSDLRNMEAN